jgi:polysaccharide deacetylase family protein (PEP-CTERM system associated)
MLNALSVDVEDAFQVGAFETTIRREDWSALIPRVEANTDKVLALFDSAGVKGTFFTLGWVAHRYPALVRVFTMTPERFGEDLAQARKAIEDAAGIAVTGYRAPSFSIDARTPWAHAVLAQAGYAYSSSIAPVVHDHYGWPEAPRFAYRPLPGEALIELPVTTAKFRGRNLAAGGGGFFRMLPYMFSRWAIRQVNRQDTRPAIFYFHPWEIDPDQPRVPGAPLKSRIRHYSRLSAMEGKLQRLLKDFSWGRVDTVVAGQVPPLS